MHMCWLLNSLGLNPGLPTFCLYVGGYYVRWKFIDSMPCIVLSVFCCLLFAETISDIIFYFCKIVTSITVTIIAMNDNQRRSCHGIFSNIFNV